MQMGFVRFRKQCQTYEPPLNNADKKYRIFLSKIKKVLPLTRVTSPDNDHHESQSHAFCLVFDMKSLQL